jgi:hypothetical protein
LYSVDPDCCRTEKFKKVQFLRRGLQYRFCGFDQIVSCIAIPDVSTISLMASSDLASANDGDSPHSSQLQNCHDRFRMASGHNVGH